MTENELPKGISKGLKMKLEKSFDNLVKDTSNPLVIAHMQNKDDEVDVYLIAKDPNEETYYGIVEHEFVTDRKIMGLPLSNILAMDLNEVPMVPFRAKAYIESKTKVNASLRDLFMSDQDFREKIIFIYFVKSQDYIALKSDDLLLTLGFSKGLDSVPMAIATTRSVKDFIVKDTGEIDFSYNIGVIGLPVITNILDLFPLLSKHCFRPFDSESLFDQIEKSNNGQLLQFGIRLKKITSLIKTSELVNILNKPEANPYIQDSDLEGQNVDKNILILNPAAYENIFKKYITAEVLEPYKKK